MISWSVLPTIPSIKVRSQVYLKNSLKECFLMLSLFWHLAGTACIVWHLTWLSLHRFYSCKTFPFLQWESSMSLGQYIFYFPGQIPTFSQCSRVGFLNLGPTGTLRWSLLREGAVLCSTGHLAVSWTLPLDARSICSPLWQTIVQTLRNCPQLGNSALKFYYQLPFFPFLPIPLRQMKNKNSHVQNLQ